MQDPPQLFIHIGAYKTGTTFLQQYVFPLWPNLTYCSDVVFPYMVLIKEGKKTLLSNETLSGRPWYRVPDIGLGWSQERDRVVASLARLFPHARIMLSIREHSGFIVSLYKQYLHEGGIHPLSRFIDLKKGGGIIDKADLYYMDTIRLIEEAFGHKPFVFTLNEIKNDFPGLISRFEKLFEEKAPENIKIPESMVNEGVRFWQALLLRFLNRLDYKSLLNDKKGILPLRSVFLKKLRIDPRSICQYRLRWLSAKKIHLPTSLQSLVEEVYSKDWEEASKYTRL